MQDKAANIINYYPADFDKLQNMDRRNSCLRKAQLNEAEDGNGKFVGMSGCGNFGGSIGGRIKKVILKEKITLSQALFYNKSIISFGVIW